MSWLFWLFVLVLLVAAAGSACWPTAPTSAVTPASISGVAVRAAARAAPGRDRAGHRRQPPPAGADAARRCRASHHDRRSRRRGDRDRHQGPRGRACREVRGEPSPPVFAARPAVLVKPSTNEAAIFSASALLSPRRAAVRWRWRRPPLRRRRSRAPPQPAAPAPAGPPPAQPAPDKATLPVPIADAIARLTDGHRGGREDDPAPDRARGGAGPAARRRGEHPVRLHRHRRDAAPAARRRQIADREARARARQGRAPRGAGHRRRARPAHGARLRARRGHQVDRAHLGARAPADREDHGAAPLAVHQEPDGAAAEPAAAGPLARPDERRPGRRSPPQLPHRRLAAVGRRQARAADPAGGWSPCSCSSACRYSVGRLTDRRQLAHRAAAALLLRAGHVGGLGGAAARAAGDRRRRAALRRARRARSALPALGAGGRAPS